MSDPLARFLASIDEDPVSGCWLWTGSLNNRGYAGGIAGYANAHRFAFEHYVGPIPPGRQIDHLCRVRHCVNPEHLEPVSPSENTRRGLVPLIVGARMLEKTHCPAGHPYAGENLVVNADGKRRCRTCRREAARLRSTRKAQP